MTNSIRILSLQALLAATLASQSSFAGQVDGPPANEPDRTTAVLGQLQELTKSLTGLVTELKNLQTNQNLYAAKAQEEINQLKQQVGVLQKDVADLRNRAPAPAPTAPSLMSSSSPSDLATSAQLSLRTRSARRLDNSPSSARG